MYRWVSGEQFLFKEKWEEDGEWLEGGGGGGGGCAIDMSGIVSVTHL